MTLNLYLVVSCVVCIHPDLCRRRPTQGEGPRARGSAGSTWDGHGLTINMYLKFRHSKRRFYCAVTISVVKIELECYTAENTVRYSLLVHYLYKKYEYDVISNPGQCKALTI